MKIAKNSVVTIEYTLTDEGGEILDTSKGREPLSYIQGMGNIIPGLENSLDGRLAGDKFMVSVQPADAYGERDEKRVVKVARDRFDGVDELEVGMQFRAEGGSGGSQIVTVTAVENDTVTIDANHPLAGKTLNFDLEVVKVRQATAEEISHGHVLGPGGAL
ncbi:MAG: peptidylprolyl isomerase [Ignavibacteriales bacterium]|nr:peptidylprolyl isomerase [Ignavibacteriales bacterium]